MTYFADGTGYQDRGGAPSRFRIHVGWLSKDVPSARGVVTADVVKALERHLRRRQNPTRGFHVCELCEAPSRNGVPWTVGWRKIRLGAAEIHIPAADGRIFHAPDLIVHYVRDHGYRPPEEFLEALAEVPWWRRWFPSGTRRRKFRDLKKGVDSDR